MLYFKKIVIVPHKQDNNLNKRFETISKCRHSNNTTWRIVTPDINSKSTKKSA